MNGSFPFLTTDLTHATCELQSSSAHHSLWLSGRASYSICRIPFYNRTFFLLIINSKTVNGHICTLSLPPQRVFVFYLHSLVRVHCINLQPLVTKPLAKLRTPVLNRVRKKNVKKNIETDDLLDSLCALRKIFALRIWLEETLVKSSLGKLCASKLTVFPELLYRKIFRFSERIRLLFIYFM